MLELQIILPDQQVLNVEAASVQAADATGRFGLRPGHEPFVTVLAPSLLVYTTGSGQEKYVAVDGGVLLLESNRVVVATREAVCSDRLEELAERAAAILDRHQAEERQAEAEFHELQAALVRQLAQAVRR